MQKTFGQYLTDITTEEEFDYLRDKFGSEECECECKPVTSVKNIKPAQPCVRKPSNT